MIFLSQYIAPPDVDVVNSILRNGFEHEGQVILNVFDEYSLHQPCSNLYVNPDLALKLRALGVESELMDVKTFNSNPFKYPRKYDRWITSDFIEDKIRKSVKKLNDKEMCRITPPKPLRTDKLYQIPFKYINGDVYNFEVKASSSYCFPIVNVGDGLLMKPEVFELLEVGLDYPFWFSCVAKS